MTCMKPFTVLFKFPKTFSSIILSLCLATVGLAAPSPQVFDENHPGIQAAIGIQNEVTPSLMQSPAILGTAIALDNSGAPALLIYIDREAATAADVAQGLPAQMRGLGVLVEHTEKFRAYRNNRHTSTSHTALQSPPIQLGTSGGWRFDLANGYCCGGTLGSLIHANGVQYILSNYHVFESDIVPGGNNMVAATGNYIIQPGLIDVRCDANGAENVGTLLKLSSLPNSNVDVGIAQVLPGMVRSDGAILEIGPLSAQTVGASLNQAVKKSGRTTGLTHSHVSGLNATISVTYENECAGGTAFTKTFTGQIVIANSGSSFLNSGDSGSLMVEDISTYPRAVGLLFAGSSTSAIANPIGQVLQFISSKVGGTASMVGF